MRNRAHPFPLALLIGGCSAFDPVDTAASAGFEDHEEEPAEAEPDPCRLVFDQSVIDVGVIEVGEIAGATARVLAVDCALSPAVLIQETEGSDNVEMYGGESAATIPVAEEGSQGFSFEEGLELNMSFAATAEGEFILGCRLVPTGEGEAGTALEQSFDVEITGEAADGG